MFKRLLITAIGAAMLALAPVAPITFDTPAPHAAIDVLADLAHGARLTNHQPTRERLQHAILALDTRGTFGVAGSLA